MFLKKYIKNNAELWKTQRYSIYNHIKLFSFMNPSENV